MVTKLSETTGLQINDLVQTYGKYLLSRFVALYPVFFQDVPDCFAFLESIDNHIHVEVHKLYPDADLPRFETKRVNDKTFEMLYRSQKPFGKLAHGLIEGALEHFGEKAEIEAIDETDPNAALSQWTFKVTRV